MELGRILYSLLQLLQSGIKHSSLSLFHSQSWGSPPQSSAGSPRDVMGGVRIQLLGVYFWHFTIKHSSEIFVLLSAFS